MVSDQLPFSLQSMPFYYDLFFYLCAVTFQQREKYEGSKGTWLYLLAPDVLSTFVIETAQVLINFLISVAQTRHRNSSMTRFIIAIL